ncbi:MAG: VWA domain-containing protein, partial [Deltaproteobacteria bacterium]|nr:VWA domain-containing protein [Deltaproteobacteria bacterium]
DLARDPLNCGGCGRAAQLEICNGQDDDCDGATDEDLSPPAAPCEIQNALGTCAGTWTCTVNGFACDAKTPLPEACNGQDDDCNGVTDDGFVDNTGAYTADRACGSCANDCTTLLAKEHAYGICNSGGLAPTCQLVCCAAGDGNARCDGTTWQDANGQPGDGCEAEVVQACTDESQCQQSEVCLGQRCTPNPQGGTCDTTADCALGDVCVGGICGCAGEQYTAEAVPPNVLIIFDRTSSMNQSAGNGQTKLQVAVAAVTQITADYDDRMRFGLLAYPATNQAGNQGEQCGAGSVFIAPALNNGPAIGAWLANVGTTNLGTPTAAALQVAIDYPGIKDPTRDNIAILITDGESSCADPVPKVTELFNLSPSVKTYVIGFGGGVDPGELNDMAVQGGTALEGETKYYDASTPATLGAALETITGDLLDCEYLLGRVPPNIEGLDVYFDRALQSLDPTHLDGWDYDAATNRLTFYGPSCQSLLEGQIDDLVFIYGCPNPIIIGSP